MGKTYPESKIRGTIDGLVENATRQYNENLSVEWPTSKIWFLVILVVIICAAVVTTHWPALSAQALSFDDSEYLTDNLLVQNPSWSSARQFLTEVLKPSTVQGYYQPLTMISLMLDYALGGRPDNLMPFHRTSLALHTVNTALVIVFLYLLFGRVWVSAGVGLLFGLHPMTVETIAWVGERKTVLAAFFALWCLVLYLRYARVKERRFYIACVVMYVLAVLSKPISLPLPVLLLLLDYWPLRRWKWKAILEKLPFFVVGSISAVITYLSQSNAAPAVMAGGYGAVRIPLVLCHNIIFYLHKIIWPANLSSHYAFPGPLGLSDPMVLAGVIGTCILIPLLVISLRWTRAPLLGWLFFFVAISPTFQVLRFSNVIAADKFAYLPSVGLLMIAASLLIWFCGTEGAGKSIARRIAVAIIVLMLAGAEALATRSYLVHWRDTLRLSEHMLKVTPDAPQVHNMLGLALQSQDNLDEAISHYRHALKIKPDYVLALNNLGVALQSQGNLDEAVNHYRQALRLKPNYADAHYNLGLAFKSHGRLDEAIKCYRQALQLKPYHVEAHSNLGCALSEQGKFPEAVEHFRRALQARPDFAEVHHNLGLALKSQSKFEEAIKHFRRALHVKPDLAEAHNNLALTLTMLGRLDGALEHFQEAVRLKPDYLAPLNRMARILAMHPDPKLRDSGQAIEFAKRAAELTRYQDAVILETLAAAYAAAGQSDRAVTTAEAALKLASDAQADELANHIRKRLEFYKQSKTP